MSDKHDSWLQNTFGFDVGGAVQTIKNEAAAVVTQAENAVTQVAQGVQGAVEGVVDGAVGAVTGAVKKVAGAAGIGDGGGGSSSSSSGGGAAGGSGSFPLRGSVGRGGQNAEGDVRAVQTALGIPSDGKCGSQTIAAIEAFQRNQGLPKADGRVDPGGATERALAGGAKPATATPPAGADADGSDGLLGGIRKTASGLIDNATAIGGQIVQGAQGLVSDASQLGAELLGGAQQAVEGTLDHAGALVDKADAGSPGLELSGKFHHELPETKFAEFPKTSYVKGSLKCKSELTAEIVKGGKGGTNKVTITTNKGLKYERELAKQKADDFSNETLRSILKTLRIKETKESLSVEFSQKKIDISVGITATIGSDHVDWIEGVATVKFVLGTFESEKLAKDPSDFVVTGLGVEGGGQGGGVIPLDDIGIPGYGLKCSVKEVLSGSVSPNWARIFAEAGKKAAEQGAKEASKQFLKGAATVAIDVVIVGGLILVAILVVVGTAHNLVVAGEERELAREVAGARNMFEQGLFKALAGEPSPGGGWLGKGWEAGNRVFQEALAKAKKSSPDGLPDEVRQQAINACNTAGKNAEIQPKITRAIGEIFWKAWIDGHHGVTTFRGAAKTACGICFARGPIANDDPDLQIWRDASDLPDAMK